MTAVYWLRFFFLNYLWLGLVIILGTVVVDSAIVVKGFLFRVLVQTATAIGIAVVVASIFSFAAGTSRFIEKVRGLLQDIVVSHEFLGNLDRHSKERALKLLLRPTSAEANIYANIEDYYDAFVSEALQVSSRCVRGSLVADCHARFDRKQDKVAVDTIMSYQLYPTTRGYDKLTVGFKGEKELSQCTNIMVSSREKIYFELKGNDIPTLKTVDRDGDKYRLTDVDLQKCQGAARLDVEGRTTEYGNERWMVLTFQLLGPTDGFRFELSCDDTVEIAEHAIFIIGRGYSVEEAHGRSLRINCRQWVSAGNGIAVLIAKK